jgi:hypothetical protein
MDPGRGLIFAEYPDRYRERQSRVGGPVASCDRIRPRPRFLFIRTRGGSAVEVFPKKDRHFLASPADLWSHRSTSERRKDGRAGGKETIKKFRANIARNPLKRLISDERIQGNPSFFEAKEGAKRA